MVNFLRRASKIREGGDGRSRTNIFVNSPRDDYDDALDTFGVHAVGGTLGAFLTGLLATAAVNANLTGTAAMQDGLARIVHHRLWLEQLKAMGITLALALVGAAVIATIARAAIGLHIAPEIERQGLDINVHGEEGYIASG